MERISAIIPSYNESAETLRKCIRSLGHGAVNEIIIVEGGENGISDAFSAGDPRIRIIHGERSRALQMNKGADTSSGELLLFIHADSVLSPGAIEEAIDILRRNEASVVSFQLVFDSKKRMYRVIEAGVRLRNLLFNFPYGDQCYLLPRDGFFSAGGFDNVPILEDVKFVEKLKKKGRLKIAKYTVATSARRFEERGILKTVLKNYLAMILYFFKFEPETILKFYGRR